MPVRNKIVEISYPAGLRKKIKTLLPQSAFAVEQKTSGGRIIHRIVGSNLQAVPTEIAAPAHWLFLPAAAWQGLPDTPGHLTKALDCHAP